MRVQLTVARSFNSPSGGIMLRAASIISDITGPDFPVSQIQGFTQTSDMNDVSGAQAKLPPNWGPPLPTYFGGSGPNFSNV